MAKFENAYPLILAHEGGYVNDPADPGGETYKGIARKMNPDWLGWHIIDLIKEKPGFPESLQSADAIEIKKQLDYEVSSFYYTHFWLKVNGEKIINQQVAESIFDFAVNAGVSVSISLSQSVVGVTADGIIGPKTIEAINRFDAGQFLTAFALAKIVRYVNICNKRPVSKKYFFGWVVRSLNHSL
ncbi:MAG: glycosyl hydrolase 108 family protein [Bacteroidota bacterium]|nr:glycosyl hydrolase 108 family protein [Bacteroidota bacterium]